MVGLELFANGQELYNGRNGKGSDKVAKIERLLEELNNIAEPRKC